MKNDITEEYAHEFKGSPPITIYKGDTSDISIANRVLAKYRKKVYGLPMAAEYRNGQFPWIPHEIVVTRGMPKDMERSVVTHEVNHYHSHQRLSPLEAVSAPFMTFGIVGLSVGLFVSEFLAFFSMGAIMTSFAINFYDQMFLEEERAEQGTGLAKSQIEADLDYRLNEDSWKFKIMDKLEKPVAYTLLPFGGVHTQLIGLKRLGKRMLSKVKT